MLVRCRICNKEYEAVFQSDNCPHGVMVGGSVLGAPPRSVEVQPRIEATNYDKEIKQLTDAMRYKLKKNAHKGRWEDLGLSDVIKRLREETDELEEAALSGSEIEIILEAADVANFALMVVNIAMKKAAKDV